MSKEEILDYVYKNGKIPEEAKKYLDDIDFVIQMLEKESSIMMDLPLDIQKKVLLKDSKYIKDAYDVAKLLVRFVCRLRLVVEADIARHVRDIAAQTNLSDVLGRRVGNLSKGYRQRVGLAQALCGEPEVLVLDEPTVGLDPRQTAEFRDTLKKLSGGRTVIFSSHILSEVQALCDRVIILHHGRVARKPSS